jgi:hypothetical protein
MPKPLVRNVCQKSRSPLFPVRFGQKRRIARAGVEGCSCIPEIPGYLRNRSARPKSLPGDGLGRLPDILSLVLARGILGRVVGDLKVRMTESNGRAQRISCRGTPDELGSRGEDPASIVEIGGMNWIEKT